MNRIYLVTSGDYSDYGVRKAFSTREKAEEWIGPLTDDYTIEEFDIDDMQDKPRASCQVSLMLFTGDVSAIHLLGNVIVFDLVFISTDLSGDQPIFSTYVDTIDKTAAIKIAGERLARFRAANIAEVGAYDLKTLRRIE